MSLINVAIFGEWMRFVVAGGVAFIVDICVLLFPQEVIGMKHNRVGILFSAAIAFAFAVFVHYLISAYWVFKRVRLCAGKGHVVTSFLFLTTTSIGFGLTEAGMWLGVVVFSGNYVVVKLLTTFVVSCWNYLAQKIFVFL